MPDGTDVSAVRAAEARGRAYRDTVDHAIRLKVKADKLLAGALRSCAVAAEMAQSAPLGEVAAGHRALQEFNVTGRGLVFRVLNRRRWKGDT